MRGIIMGKQSIELIRAGRKTQTRRVRSTNPYRVGEKLYVKEPVGKRNGEWCYRDGHPARLGGRSISHPVPAAFLPEEWARLFLIVRAHRVEQLHEITADDALREGVDPTSANPVGSYRDWWEALHGRGAWDVNPFVDVYDFEHFTIGGENDAASGAGPAERIDAKTEGPARD